MKFFKKRFGKHKKIDEEFVRAEAEQVEEADVQMVIDNSERIESTVAKSSRFDAVISEVKLMLSLIKDYRGKRYSKVPWFSIAAIVATLLYVLNPLDLVPDYIPMIGFIDDATVFTFALNMVSKDLNAYRDWKNENEKINV